jgi:hypothetical protein
MKDEEIPVEAPKMETTPITDDFLNDLKVMPNEPVKKVVIENEPQKTQEVLIKNDEGIFEEIQLPINETIRTKATDEDVVNIIDHISIDTLPFVNNLIVERTKSLIDNSEAFNNLDFSEHTELIYSEVKKRLGILLIK